MGSPQLLLQPQVLGEQCCVESLGEGLAWKGRKRRGSSKGKERCALLCTVRHLAMVPEG